MAKKHDGEPIHLKVNEYIQLEISLVWKSFSYGLHLKELIQIEDSVVCKRSCLREGLLLDISIKAEMQRYLSNRKHFFFERAVLFHKRSGVQSVFILEFSGLYSFT